MSSRQQDKSPSKRRPRNYLARREQLRLLMLVGTLMLVFLLMNEAGKKKNWEWLTGPEGDPLTEAERGGSEDIDTREVLVAGNNIEQIPGTIVTTDTTWKPPKNLDDEGLALRRAEMDFWREPVPPPDWPRRPELPVELEVEIDADGEPVTLVSAERRAATLTLLDEHWQASAEQASETIAADPHVNEEDQALWLAQLQMLQSGWKTQLESAASATPETGPQAISLKQFDELWREVDRFDRRRQRRQRRDLPRLLKTVRDNRPLSADDAKSFRATLALLDARWQAYTKQAIDAAIANVRLSQEDRGAWLTILQELRKQWNEQLHDALAAAVDPAQLTDAQRRELARFEELFDELSLDAVRDNTFVPRIGETNAWFRLLEHLQKADQDLLVAAEAPRVGFRQLYQQPGDYRGRLIRIRGNAKLAYHLMAPSNIDGIEGYYHFVLFPLGGTDPILVYTLELPPGFPEVKDRDIDKEVTELDDVPVEFTGYFFKCAAYTAGDGSRVAPLILAKTATWTPKPAVSTSEMPNVWLLAGAVVVIALLSIGLAMLVYVRHGATPAQKYSAAARVQPQQFAALAEEVVAPSPEERLQDLANDDANSPTTGS